MSDTGNVNVSGEGKVIGPAIGANSGEVNTTYNITHKHEYAPPPPIDLATAQARYAALPTDAVPDVAPLPAGSWMPLSRNPLFVGRESQLLELAATLKGGGMAAIGPVAAATGLGGIGKTQLASEFVHRYGQFFAGGAFWLSFASSGSVPAEIAACGGAGAMNLPGFDALTLDDQVGRVVQEWQSPAPRLLVFDNCEDEALLDRWRPKSGGCRILLTSRRPAWNPGLGVQTLALEVLRREESFSLLCKYRADLANHVGHITAIAAELGDLPLALHLAGSFLATYRDSLFGIPSSYLRHICQPALLNHPSLQGEGITFSPTDHDLHVARTFLASYERLNTEVPADALARSLLARAAYFVPGEPIPRNLLIQTSDVAISDLAALFHLEQSIIRLISLGLLTPEPSGALRLHRLLVKFVRAVEPDVEAAEQAVETTLLRLFNRALVDQREEAWTHLYEHYRGLIERWVRQGTRQARSKEEIDECVMDVFARLWRVMKYEPVKSFPTLDSLLIFWRMCANTVIIDRQRQEAAEARLLDIDDAEQRNRQMSNDPVIENDKDDFWHFIDSQLMNEEERVLIHGLYKHGYNLRELLAKRPDLFRSVTEMYGTRLGILQRLGQNNDLRQWLER